MITAEILFYGGIGVMALSLVMAVVAIVVLCLTGRHLRTRLSREYGKRRC